MFEFQLKISCCGKGPGNLDQAGGKRDGVFCLLRLFCLKNGMFVEVVLSLPKNYFNQTLSGVFFDMFY